MEDRKIVELYHARDESAIAETNRKYGRYCHAIAYRILQNDRDSEECSHDRGKAADHPAAPAGV